MKLPPYRFSWIYRDRYGGLNYQASSRVRRQLGGAESRKCFWFWIILIWSRFTKKEVSSYYEFNNKHLNWIFFGRYRIYK